MNFRLKLNKILFETTFDILWHGTIISRSPMILKYGLDPAKSVYADDEELNDAEGFGPPYHFVYLSTRKAAVDFASTLAKNTGDRPVLFRVMIPPELQKKLVLNRGEFIRAPFLIPPQYLEQVPMPD